MTSKKVWKGNWKLKFYDAKILTFTNRIETHYYENWTTKLHEKNPIDKMKYNYIYFLLSWSMQPRVLSDRVHLKIEYQLFLRSIFAWKISCFNEIGFLLEYENSKATLTIDNFCLPIVERNFISEKVSNLINACII